MCDHFAVLANNDDQAAEERRRDVVAMTFEFKRASENARVSRRPAKAVRVEQRVGKQQAGQHRRGA